MSKEYVGIRDKFQIDRAGDAVGAALAGGIAAGLLLQLWSADWIRYVARTVGGDGLTLGWVALLFYCAVLGLLFAGGVSGTVNSFVTQTMMLSRRSDALRKVLVPLLNRSALGVTLGGMGLLYGLAVGVLGFGLALPAWNSFVLDAATPFPLLHPVGVAAFAAYGGLTGLVYGMLGER